MCPDLRDVLTNCKSLQVASSADDLIALACGHSTSDTMAVEYALPDGRIIKEAQVSKVRNGICVNYYESYMRRRDPETMVIADDKPTDKVNFETRFHQDFDTVRRETLDWLKSQDLAAFAFDIGREGICDQALAVVPRNAAFFAFGLALLQGILPLAGRESTFHPRAVIYVAPPFRHTLFDAKQVVVHNRRDDLYEMFSYNLYPGPSAKKGVYGMLIQQGERDGWITAHCSTVQVVTPYDNVTTIMHEGASGGGKSEMLQHAHRELDGSLLIGENLVNGERRYLEIPRSCDLMPVTDDMAICHPKLQQRDNGKLWITDAEDGWFVRVDHITEYGADLDLEKLTAHPQSPLLFLNIDAVPNSRALIWEHTQDSPGVPCPNPRVVIPRSSVPNVVNEPVSVDIRSMGIRTPPCTRERPSYGIFGILHILPPSLAWLWRLVAPRGFANPSITESKGLSSEGVGSYWPFATGKRIPQANLLLRQIVDTPRVRYILTPNQHIGAWKTGFMPQWIAREYLARRGMAGFKKDQIRPARCPLLGMAMYSMRVEGTFIPHWFLEVNEQPEVGNDGYDRGAEMLTGFFKETLREYLSDDLDPLGRQIIECCLNDGQWDDYEALIS